MSKLGTIVVTEKGELLILDASGKAGASFLAECCMVIEPGEYGRNQVVKYDHAKEAHALAVGKTAFPDPADRPKAGATEEEAAAFQPRTLAKRAVKLTDGKGKHTGWSIEDQ